MNDETMGRSLLHFTVEPVPDSEGKAEIRLYFFRDTELEYRGSRFIDNLGPLTNHTITRNTGPFGGIILRAHSNFATELPVIAPEPTASATTFEPKATGTAYFPDKGCRAEWIRRMLWAQERVNRFYAEALDTVLPKSYYCLADEPWAANQPVASRLAALRLSVLHWKRIVAVAKDIDIIHGYGTKNSKPTLETLWEAVQVYSVRGYCAMCCLYPGPIGCEVCGLLCTKPDSTYMAFRDSTYHTVFKNAQAMLGHLEGALYREEMRMERNVAPDFSEKTVRSAFDGLKDAFDVFYKSVVEHDTEVK